MSSRSRLKRALIGWQSGYKESLLHGYRWEVLEEAIEYLYTWRESRPVGGEALEMGVEKAAGLLRELRDLDTGETGRG